MTDFLWEGKADQSKWDRRWMSVAQLIATFSKDPSTKVGAVLIANNRIISTGFNGFPERCQDDKPLYDVLEIKYERVVHAEANALIAAPFLHQMHLTLYTTAVPCSTCAGLVINSGVNRVVAIENPDYETRWKDRIEHTLTMFEQSGVALEFIAV